MPGLALSSFGSQGDLTLSSTDLHGAQLGPNSSFKPTPLRGAA
jgi:hypothetical protein